MSPTRHTQADLCPKIDPRPYTSQALERARNDASSHGLGVDPLVAFGVALVDVLEHGAALLLVEVGGVGPREACVQGVLDGIFQPRPGAEFLAPVQDQEFLEAVEQVPGHLLDLGALLGA